MNIFRPLTRHVSPSRTAVVRIAATSEPASGSVIAIAPIFSPAIAGTSHRSRCSSVPKCARAGVAMCDCTEIAIGIAVAAAEPRGVVQAEETQLAAPPEQRIGELARALPLVDVRPDLRVDEAA